MGRVQADIVCKYTTRWKEADDEDEIICKYVPKRECLEEYESDCRAERSKILNSLRRKAFESWHRNDCQIDYDQKPSSFREECTFNEFLKARFHLRRIELLNAVKTGFERFWDAVADEIESRSVEVEPDPLPEAEYLTLIDKYFELNPKYNVDLEDIEQQHSDEIRAGQARIADESTNPGCLVRHEGKAYVLYGNNLLYKAPVRYGFDIGSIKSEWPAQTRHLVLTASLPNIHRICREEIGRENVVTAFTYSQIPKEELLNHSDGVMGPAKANGYEDIERYARNIVNFDYALIYAETSLENRTGNQKSELVDQLFRLFRSYGEQ